MNPSLLTRHNAFPRGPVISYALAEIFAKGGGVKVIKQLVQESSFYGRQRDWILSL